MLDRGGPRGRGVSCRRPRLPLALGVILLLALAGCEQDAGGDLQRAVSLQETGAYEESLEVLRGVLRDQADDPEANFRLGTALLALGRPTEAVFPLQRAARHESHLRAAGLALATAMAQTRNYSEAIRWGRRVLEVEPESEAALLVVSQSALEVGDGEQALEAADALVAVTPDSPQALLIRAAALGRAGRHEEAVAAFRALEKDPPGDNEKVRQQIAFRACLALAQHIRIDRDEPDAVETTLRECVASHPESEGVYLGAATMLTEVERVDAATEILEQGHQAFPDSGAIRAALAQRLVAADRLEEAVELVLAQAEETQTAESWAQVAQVRRQAGDPTGALEAIDRALALEPENEELRFARADILIENDRPADARAARKAIETPLFQKLIDARLLLVEGHPAEALALYDAALEQWPNNVGARVLAAEAALALGDEERGKRELLEASRHAKEETDAALWLARLHLAAAEYRRAIRFANRHLDLVGPSGPEAFLIMARAALGLGQPEAAQRTLEALAKARDGAFAAVAAAESAAIVARAEGPEAGLARLDAAIDEYGLDRDTADGPELLPVRAQLLLDAGHADQARQVVHAALERHPDDPTLVAMAARIELREGKLEAARSGLERALAMDPEHPEALAGMALVLQAKGDAPAALAMMRHAAKAAPANAQILYMAARMQLEQGQRAEAEEGFQRVLRILPDHVAALNDLAWLLAEDGRELERAESLALRAVRHGRQAATLDTLGTVRMKLERTEAARKTFEKALEEDPDYASARYHLGLVLAELGEAEQAKAALRQALAEPGFAEASEARTALARLEGEGSR